MSETFHPAQLLPHSGLAVSLDQLQELQATIHTLPLETQAQYADKWCQQMSVNEQFATTGAAGMDEESTFPGWNTTSVGNCAYMALHAPTKNLRALYKQTLAHYCQWKTDRSHTYYCTIM